MKKSIGLFAAIVVCALSVKSQDTLSQKKKAVKPYYDSTKSVTKNNTKEKVNIMDMQKKPLQKWPDSLATKPIDSLKKEN